MVSFTLTTVLSAALAFAHRGTSVKFLIRWILNFFVGWLGVMLTNMFLGAMLLQLNMFSMIGASLLLLISNIVIWIRFAPNRNNP